ncbi:hypothetical protein [Bradyrhizobium oligotrophicum]|uniref:hypothetical protein n=1 Tax=Bradyrhizobium oligotrophicum TaxID=44255 RepID=UPI003EBC9521
MNLIEMQHEPSGLSFREWLDDPTGMPITQPIGLDQIQEIFNAGFGHHRLTYGDWLDGFALCVAAVVLRGFRPMLPNYETRRWEWTTRFNGETGDDDTPLTVAKAAIFSACAFGDSGGAEHLRFGTRLPDGPLPARSLYYP